MMTRRLFVTGAAALTALTACLHEPFMIRAVFSFDDDLDPAAAGWGEEEDRYAGGAFREETPCR